MNRIAPNNTLPATHFIEVYSNGITTNQEDGLKNPTWKCVNIIEMGELGYEISRTLKTRNLYTVCLFRIRENKLPTLHNFKPKEPC